MSSSPLRIALVAGELSGDHLGAALIDAIRARCPEAQFEGIAGPRMRAAGFKPAFPERRATHEFIVSLKPEAGEFAPPQISARRP